MEISKELLKVRTEIWNRLNDKNLKNRKSGRWKIYTLWNYRGVFENSKKKEQNENIIL